MRLSIFSEKTKMRRINILLAALFFLTSLTSVGQKTKKVKVQHKNPWFVEEYYVLKKDKNVRHGSYQKFGFKNSLLISGFYKNNTKDSLWTSYFRGDNKVKSQGSYLNDKRIGIWEFYNHKSELVQKYDFDRDSLIYFTPEEKEFEIVTENGIVKTKLDSPPLFIGGVGEASESIFENLEYPVLAAEQGISGVVYISFFIDAEGNPKDYEIEKGIGGGCDEAALRTIKLLPNTWVPGYLNGKPVTTKFIFPIRFQLG